jgi:hypothetical protein
MVGLSGVVRAIQYGPWVGIFAKSARCIPIIFFGNCKIHGLSIASIACDDTYSIGNSSRHIERYQQFQHSWEGLRRKTMTLMSPEISARYNEWHGSRRQWACIGTMR